jgi:hypothetical protein
MATGAGLSPLPQKRFIQVANDVIALPDMLTHSSRAKLSVFTLPMIPDY